MELKLDQNLQQRIISAAILIPVILVIVWTGGMVFNLLLLFATVIMAFEWNQIVGNRSDMDPIHKRHWMLAGVGYVAISVGSLMYLRGLEQGFSVVIALLLTVWAVDIAAFFVGRTVGGPKICPSISPNKTWSGLVGGMAGAALVNIVIGLIFGTPILWLMLMGALMAIIAQIGDFVESWIKRQFYMKDSGFLIPGHGGLLDRVDGLTTTAPVIALMALLNHGMVPLWS